MNNKINIITAIDNKELKIQFAKIHNYYCVTIFNKTKSDFEFLGLSPKELVQLLSKYGDITYTTEYFKVNAYNVDFVASNENQQPLKEMPDLIQLDEILEEYNTGDTLELETIECFDRENEEINILGYCFNYQL